MLIPQTRPYRAAALPSRPSPTPARRLLIVAFAVALALVAALPASHARAGLTATQAEAKLLGWINEARVARGLVPLVYWVRLAEVAGKRATKLAEKNLLSHTASGDLADQLKAKDVSWYRYGETIGYSLASWTEGAAKNLFDMWKGSSAHWKLLMSDKMNYAGVGLAHRDSNGRTFGSVVLTESVDHTGARALVTGVSRNGDDVTWSWKGWDPYLQTHRAGLRDFDLQYRVNGGSWTTIRNDTTGTKITLLDRVHGRTYGLRVRATDKRGTVGPWTNETKIYVP